MGLSRSHLFVSVRDQHRRVGPHLHQCREANLGLHGSDEPSGQDTHLHQLRSNHLRTTTDSHAHGIMFVGDSVRRIVVVSFNQQSSCMSVATGANQRRKCSVSHTFSRDNRVKSALADFQADTGCIHAYMHTLAYMKYMNTSTTLHPQRIHAYMHTLHTCIRGIRALTCVHAYGHTCIPCIPSIRCSACHTRIHAYSVIHALHAFMHTMHTFAHQSDTVPTVWVHGYMEEQAHEMPAWSTRHTSMTCKQGTACLHESSDIHPYG